MFKIPNKNAWVIVLSLLLIFLGLIYITYSIINKQNSQLNSNLSSSNSFSSIKSSTVSSYLCSSGQSSIDVRCGFSTTENEPRLPGSKPVIIIDDSIVTPITTKN